MGIYMKAGRWYEDKTETILKNIVSDDKKDSVNGETEFSVDGKTGSWKRKVDVRISVPGDPDFIFFECKDHKQKIKSIDIDQIIVIKEELSAKSVYLVTNGGLDGPQLIRAEHYGITVLHIIDPSDPRIKVTIKLPVVYNFHWISRFRQKSYFGDSQLSYYDNPQNIVDANSSTTMYDLLCLAWNENQISRRKGVQTFNMGFHLWKFSESKVLSPADCTELEYDVSCKSYLIEAPLKQGSGFYNVKEKTFVSDSKFISFGPIKISDIMQGIDVTGKSMSEYEVSGDLFYKM